MTPDRPTDLELKAELEDMTKDAQIDLLRVDIIVLESQVKRLERETESREFNSRLEKIEQDLLKMKVEAMWKLLLKEHGSDELLIESSEDDKQADMERYL
jgi:galactokinase